MTTIAQLYPENVKRLSVRFPFIAEACRHFDTFAGLDDALGYTSASAKWVRGEKNPAPRAERAAQLWLEARGKAKAASEASPNGAPATPSDAVVVIAGNSEAIAKIVKLAALLGCESIDV